MVAKGKKRLYPSISEEAEQLLRLNIGNKKGDISNYIENCILKDFKKEVKP